MTANAGSEATILIIGTGIAGLTAALKFSSHHRVYLISKAAMDEGATRYAQGGIASVWSKSDSFEAHKSDTLRAGGGLCKEEIVDLCVREGPDRVRELINWGVPFTKVSELADPEESFGGTLGSFDLHREGGHGHRRILHASDITGWEIVRTLITQVKSRPNITVLEHHLVIDLITEGKILKKRQGMGAGSGKCLGAYVLDNKSGKVRSLRAHVTVLATGGAGKVYLYTSNPDVATGDGVAMAYRAGARVANLEFMQFHPTCLYHPAAKNFLITEAVRGEGAVLKDLRGREFMKDYDERGSLAPRDIVARAIDFEMKRSGDPHVLLDATKLGVSARDHFPSIYDVCRKFGVDMLSQPIPVVPAAHYLCGGAVINEHGETSVQNLYAVGEVSCSGLHGANRLASNSLLEAVVFAERVVRHSEKSFDGGRAISELPRELPEWDSGAAVPQEDKIDIGALWHEVRSLMWNYVGIVRSDRRLERARRRLDLIQADVTNDYWKYDLTKDLVETRNLVLVAQLMVQSALLRKESRGLHYTVDYPDRNDEVYRRDTVL